MAHEPLFRVRAAGRCVVAAFGALFFTASPLFAQAGLTRTSAPAIVRLADSHAGERRDSRASAVRRDSVVSLDSAATDDDALGVESGIVVVDRFGHPLPGIPPELRRPDDAVDYAKSGSAARAPAHAAMTPPPSTAPSSL